MKREFVCAGCGHTFVTDTPDSAMEVEFSERYGHGQSDSDDDIVSGCDACYAIANAARTDHGNATR